MICFKGPLQSWILDDQPRQAQPIMTLPQAQPMPAAPAVTSSSGVARRPSSRQEIGLKTKFRFSRTNSIFRS